MKFGEVAIADAAGAILAHSLRQNGVSLKKGRVLNTADIDVLAEAGIETVVAARMEDGDIGEDAAATRIAQALAGSGVTAAEAFTGRVNLIAETDGLVVFDANVVQRINLVDEAVTVATAPPFERAAKNQIVATIKIIPYAVPEKIIIQCLDAAAQAQSEISLAPLQRKQIALTQTTLGDMKESIFAKTAEVTRTRVEGLGSSLIYDDRVSHAESDVAASVKRAAESGADIFLIAGASAITDRRDVIPAGIVEAGGEVIHCGMPVDPGNLLLVGAFGKMTVIGIPGCARSPKFNGIDLVLRRLVAGLPVTSHDIMALGVGGLLKEFADRPTPRAAAEETLPSTAKIAGLILAAGQSRRMGKINKLLADVDGEAMVKRAAAIVTASQASPVVAVTGHQAEEVSKALRDFDLTLVHNPAFADGISSSLQRGLASLPADIDGVVVCLGDMPKVSPHVIDKLIAAFNPTEQRAICLPTWQGKRGNPVLLARRFFSEINDISGDVGARGLLGQYPELVCEIEIDSDAVLLDIDTPEALEKANA